jgi:Protein of unknown function (DUF1592)/Protein of unknown function (DUF1588)/Protein of unknown function (DUF1595)
VAGVLFALGCGGESNSQQSHRDRGGGTGGGAGSSGTASSGVSGQGAAGSSGAGPGGEGGVGEEACATTPLVPRRLVRLSKGQVVTSVGVLAGDAVEAEIRATEYVDPPESRPFPPLALEGSAIGEPHFAFGDRIARAVGKHTLEDFAQVTGCGAAPDDACGRAFVTSFAERAFRRPLVDAERENLLTVYSECKALGGTVQEAVQHGVWAVLDSPLFLYRTELGEGDVASGEVTLTSHEMASSLAYFLTDAPPDAELLEVASRAELSTPDAIGAQATRLLETPAVRANLEAAMASYFQLSGSLTLVIDPAVVPGIEVTRELLGQIHHEGELFLRERLWNGPLEELLTSRRTFVNAAIATSIYGIEPPTAGLDADGFGSVELPEYRAGLLTLSSFLTSRTRSTGASVVGRGMFVNAALACAVNPPFPEPIPEIPDAPPMVDWTERQKADYRASEPLCDGCHAQFDAFGLALDVFDGIGRYRTTDSMGRPIDSAVVLPETFERERISGPAELAAVIASSEHFKACMVMSFMEFALADVSQGGPRAPFPAEPASTCEVRNVVRAFDARPDRSFGDLIVEVARSPMLRLRLGGL